MPPVIVSPLANRFKSDKSELEDEVRLLRDRVQSSSTELQEFRKYVRLSRQLLNFKKETLTEALTCGVPIRTVWGDRLAIQSGSEKEMEMNKRMVRLEAEIEKKEQQLQERIKEVKKAAEEETSKVRYVNACGVLNLLHVSQMP